MEMGNKSNGQMQWTGDGVAVEPDWKQMWGSLSLILPEAVDQRREGQLAMDGKCRSSIKKELENRLVILNRRKNIHRIWVLSANKCESKNRTCLWSFHDLSRKPFYSIFFLLINLAPDIWVGF